MIQHPAKMLAHDSPQFIIVHQCFPLPRHLCTHKHWLYAGPLTWTILHVLSVLAICRTMHINSRPTEIIIYFWKQKVAICMGEEFD